MEFEEKLEAVNCQIEDLAVQDPLTDVANRRQFEERLQTEHGCARRLHLPLSVATTDVDELSCNHNMTKGKMQPTADSEGCRMGAQARGEKRLGRSRDDRSR